jgi:surface polysaccharide O-acyltransferase-like enzyme
VTRTLSIQKYHNWLVQITVKHKTKYKIIKQKYKNLRKKMYLLYRYALLSNNSDALYTYSKENNWEGDIYIYIYILSLICFVRMDFWGKYRIEYEMRWKVHFEQNMSKIVCLSTICQGGCYWRQYNITWCFF